MDRIVSGELGSAPGTYALVLRCESRGQVRIGRWGQLTVVPCYYIYVGSARGPGGIRARVSRHFREFKARHWHIDYLREQASPVFAWISYNPVNQEHQWARGLAAMAAASPVDGFGCSDCRCRSHLFTVRGKPELAQFAEVLGDDVQTWPRQFFASDSSTSLRGGSAMA